MVAYQYYANNILTAPLKNRTLPFILNGLTKIYDKLIKRVFTPKLHIVDNEVSEDLKQYFEDSDIQFQLVPQHMHRRKYAERAVRTFKNHFIAALCTVAPIPPFYLWDHLLPQVTMTLNMLWRYQLNPGLSTYEKVYGIHKFERKPLSPLGCKVKIHEKPHKQLTYAPHSVDGWYLGPAVHHYRCYTCYNIDTGGETTPDTIAFFPEFMKMPNYSSRDMSIHAAADLSKSLQTPRPESPFQMGDSQLKAIRKLANIFYSETKIPNRGVLPTPPDPLMNNSTKLPRV